MARYRKMPIEIEAMQYTDVDHNVANLIDWVESYGVGINYHCNNGEECRQVLHSLKISTLEGYMFVSPGDWVIKGVVNEFYPCKPEIFAATYEAV